MIVLSALLAAIFSQPLDSIWVPEPPRTVLIAEGCMASYNPDGSAVVYARSYGETSGLSILDVETGTSKRLTESGKDPAWSPDGSLIAYVEVDDATSQEEVWLVSPTGEDRKRVMEGGYPGWSGDGSQLYVHSRASNAIFACNPKDSEGKPHVFFEACTAWYPAVSPDGKSIAFSDGNLLRVISRDTREERLRWRLQGARGLLPHWSPDGAFVGIGGFDSDPAGVWVVNIETGKVARVAGGLFTLPSWRPDGKTVIFDERSNAGLKVWAVPSEALEFTTQATAQAEGKM